MAFKYSVLALFIACLIALSQAVPIKDVSNTSIEISTTYLTPSSERFAVTVQRLDELIDDDGKLLAEKISSVLMTFDIEDGQILVNKVPIELGFSSVQVFEAQIIPADVKPEDFSKYQDNFDVGLVTVEVESNVESFTINVEKVIGYRVRINIRILEIDGENVVQTEATEKIIEYKALDAIDGDKDDITAPIYADNQETATTANDNNNNNNNNDDDNINSYSSNYDALNSRVRHWWRCSPKIVRIVITSLLLTLSFGIFFMAVPAIIQGFIRLVPKNSSLHQPVTLGNDGDNDDGSEKVIFVVDDEKLPLMLEQEKI
jgi:hypothetical protein